MSDFKFQIFKSRLVVCLIALICLRPVSTQAISCYSNFGFVREADPVQLKILARDVADKLASWENPLDPAELRLLDEAIRSTDRLTALRNIQRVLDGHCLIALSISTEAEVKATPGPAMPFLATGRWGVFLIKVDNLGRQPVPLRIDSGNLVIATENNSDDRWLEWQIWPEPVLSGNRVDYFVLRLRGNVRGKRDAEFAFSTTIRPLQQPGPLSYNRMAVLFSLVPEPELAQTKLAHLLKHQHAGPYASSNRRGPPLVTIRADACLECHDTASVPAVAAKPPPRTGEQSCIACHRELAPKLAGSQCPICGMQKCQMGCVSSFTSSSGQKTMRMAGLPRWLFLTGIGSILVLSFLGVEVLDRRRDSPTNNARRWNLLQHRFMSWFSRQRWTRTAFQFSIFAIFCFLIYAGLAGDQTVNITPIVTWTIWWSGLIFLILFLGKAWCFVCPWEFSATLAQSLPRLWGRSKPLTLGRPWPNALRNIYPAVGLFVVLTWLELGYGVTNSPRATAILGLLMVLLSVTPALLFERRGFCRYACMIGRISGLYALFSPVEVRAANRDLCRRCETRDCFNGNERAPGCPTSLLLPAVQTNTYCVMCGYCARSCPNHNVALNIRPFGADLFNLRKSRPDESLLAIVLLALTSFHGLTMTPFWDAPTGVSVIGLIRQVTHFPALAAFTLGMSVMLLLPVLIYLSCCWVTTRLVPAAGVSTRMLLLGFAGSLLPVALFYHLAHNSMHFFMEAQYLTPLLSNPLGRATDYFGTAGIRSGPLLSAETIWYLQVGLILLGHVFGIIAAHHAARRIYSDSRQAAWSLAPMLAGMILFSWYSLWLLHLDMNMRSTLM